MVLHFILIVGQTVFLLSLPILLYLPTPVYIAYILGFIILNDLFCRLLNGNIPPDGLQSTKDAQTELWKKHDDESWIFLNGVSVGYVFASNKLNYISNH